MDEDNDVGLEAHGLCEQIFRFAKPSALIDERTDLRDVRKLTEVSRSSSEPNL